MKQIMPILLKSLPNDEHLQFHTEVKALITEMTPNALNIFQLYLVYERAYNMEKATVEVALGNAMTNVIKQADLYRDILERGFYLFVESKTMHFLPEQREAAERVKRILDQYGDLRKLNYSKETSNIISRHTELYNSCREDLDTIMAVEWLTAMAASTADFTTNYGERSNVEAAKISSNVNNMRLDIDPALDDIVLFINSLNVVNGGDNDIFVERMNYIITHYKNLIAARKGHKKAAETPVTPVV